MLVVEGKFSVMLMIDPKLAKMASVVFSPGSGHVWSELAALVSGPV